MKGAAPTMILSVLLIICACGSKTKRPTKFPPGPRWEFTLKPHDPNIPSERYTYAVYLIDDGRKLKQLGIRSMGLGKVSVFTIRPDRPHKQEKWTQEIVKSAVEPEKGDWTKVSVSLLMKADFRDETILMSSSFVMTRAHGSTTANVVREQVISMPHDSRYRPKRKTERTIARFVK